MTNRSAGDPSRTAVASQTGVAMLYGVEQTVDLDRYPLDCRDVPGLLAVIEHARDELATTGLVVVPEFLRPEAVVGIAAEALLDASAPRLTAYDRIPGTAAVKQLYRWEPLLGFVSRVVGEPVHRSADALAAMTVQMDPPGTGQEWHFDMSEYTVELHIVAPEQGGVLEYSPLPMDFPPAGPPGVRRRTVQLLATAPGALVLYPGRRARHRITLVRGNIPRVVVSMAFHLRPGQRLNDQVRRRYFGRTE
ncbi:HalD/BesD family halogenase [Nocardia yamanashiensis]|uniref:HalD/BesD family halogenase n=1 Tax=Nocardia yamanashiensis TaxID=209247 RepID=UPI0012FDD60F|nr:hypothetical protein [Nocardia yamanashiensis]